MTEEQILELTSDVKFMQKLEEIIPRLQMIRPIRNVIQAVTKVSEVFNSEYVMLEGLYILQKRSNLTKSQRETILHIIEFAVDEYKRWKNGETETNNEKENK